VTRPCASLAVVVTGSECTGKTTLARDLARHFSCPCAAEHARAYAEANPHPLTAADVEPIARGQVAAEDAAAAAALSLGARCAVLDTDLVSTVVYARHYYRACPAWIEEAARARLGDVYLLCHPDVPWIADGVRDRGEGRIGMHVLFELALAEFGARVVSIRGPWDERRDRAVSAALDLLRR
jgi:NadR type nicotinamide-nucleotide adenylyltransferase